MAKKNTIVYTVAFIILFILLAIGLYLHYIKEKEDHPQLLAEAGEVERRDEEKSSSNLKWTEDQIKDKGIEIKSAGPGQLRMIVPSRGKVIVHPDHLAHVVPKVSGVAKEIRKNLGDKVAAGEVMVLLESREIADAKAHYLSALTKERLSKATAARELKLYKKNISAEQDYLNAQNSYEEAKINVQLAKQKLQVYGLNEEEIEALAFDDQSDFRLYPIKAPIDGTVIKRHVSSGEFIQDTAAIYEVADLRKVWVEMGVYPQDLLSIKEKQSIEIVAPIENQTGKGWLTYISPVIDDETLLIKAIAELENPNGDWRAGTFVNIKITTDMITAPLVVTKEALQNVEGSPCLFIVNSEGIQKRPVKLGRSDQLCTEVLSGLEPGERYLGSQTFLIKAEFGKDSLEDDD